MARAIDADIFIRDLTAMKKMYDAIELDGMIKALKEAPTIEPKQEWISVEDRLPEEGRRVLVSLTLNRSYTDIDTDRMLDGNWRRWGRDVTHWMPLPEPPKEGE